MVAKATVREEDERGADGGDARDKACGDRTEALHGMETIRLIVGNVVQEIECRGNERKRASHGKGHQKGLPAPGDLALRRVRNGEEPGHQDDAVLRPLLDAQRAQPDPEPLAH